MSSIPPPELHVVLGAGQIGSRLAELLLSRGHRVRSVRRSAATAGSQPRHETRHGDMAQLAFAEEACAGATAVYDCMNPPYHRWTQELVPLAGGALHGAAKAQARLVALDCLYMYGRPETPMHEDSPFAPQSKKGELRVKLHELRMGAHAAGKVRVTLGRASDFLGSNLPNSSLGSERFWGRVAAGKPAEFPINIDTPHAYTYVEDVAKALATLGSREDAFGKVWMLPTAPASTTRALAERLANAAGTGIRFRLIPPLVLRGMGLFSPLLREFAEMTYQWDGPFLVDDQRFRTTFGVEPTPLEEAIRETGAWARSAYVLARAA